MGICDEVVAVARLRSYLIYVLTELDDLHQSNHQVFSNSVPLPIISDMKLVAFAFTAIVAMILIKIMLFQQQFS